MHDPAMRILDAIRAKGRRARQSKAGSWKCQCPAHKDARESLSVSRGADGQALIHCFAGCSSKDIVAALGLKESDLFPRQARDPAPPRPRDTWEETIAEYERFLGGERAGTWEYSHADGSEAFRVVRFETPEGKAYRPFHRTPGGTWEAGYGPGPLPMYGLRGIARADRVYVFEGEKCADLAAGIGLAAVTSASGAGSAGRTDWSPLAGREVAIVPDCDAAGERYAASLIETFGTLAPTPRVRIVRLPGLADGDDIEQWLDRLPADWTADRRREAFEAIADEAELVLSPAPMLRAFRPAPEEPPRPTGRPPKRHDAADWLRNLLSAGPVPSAEVYARAAAQGYSMRTIKRAVGLAGVVSYQQPGQWWMHVGPEGVRVPKPQGAKSQSAKRKVRNPGQPFMPHDRHEPILMECPAVDACMAGAVAPGAKPAPGVPSAPVVDPAPLAEREAAAPSVVDPIQEAPGPELSREADGPNLDAEMPPVPPAVGPETPAAEPAAPAPPDWWLAPPPEEVPLPAARRETPREVFRDFLRDQLRAGLIRRHAGPAVEREAGALVAHPAPDVDRMRSIWTAVEKAAWIERYAASGVPMPA